MNSILLRRRQDTLSARRPEAFMANSPLSTDFMIRGLYLTNQMALGVSSEVLAVEQGADEATIVADVIEFARRSLRVQEATLHSHTVPFGQWSVYMLPMSERLLSLVEASKMATLDDIGALQVSTFHGGAAVSSELTKLKRDLGY
jgi:hypothetical protein